MKRGWIIAAVIVAAVAAVWAWGASGPDATVRVVRPETGTIRAYVEEQAVTRLPRDYLISMPIAGWLEPITLREGDTVEKDQVVAELETSDLQDRVQQAAGRVAELEARIAETQDHRLERNALVEVEATVKAIDETVKAAEAKLEAARATVDFTESELERVRNLIEDDAVASRELRQAELDYRRARAEYQGDLLELAALKTLAAVSYIGPKFIHDYIDRKQFTLEVYRRQLDQAQADLEIARRNLARAEIRSPVAGVILHRMQTRRQYLAAGTPLLTIGQLSELEVVAEILSERAPQIERGDPVEIFGEALPAAVAGTVARVYPAGFTEISSLGVEQQRVNVTIDLSDERPPRLGVGFRVYVRIVHDEAPRALTLPRPTLFRTDTGAWAVMVVEDDSLAVHEVQVGLMNDERAQITDGLDGDARVVAVPSNELTPGMHVAIDE